VLPVGQKTVQAKDAFRNSASASFTITPSISLTKTSGTVGSANTVNGSGFGVNKGVDVTIAGVAITFDTPCNTDGNGSFSCGFTIPVAPSGGGQKTVQATDKANNSASANFTYLASISLTNTSGIIGSSNTMNGTAFAANASLTATLGGAAITFTGPCNTDGNGSFSCSFDVPVTSAGQKTVQATDAAGNSASSNFTLSFSIWLTSTSGAVGDIDTLNGTGFFAGKTVTNATLGGVGIGFLSSCSTDGTGSFSCAFRVPATTAGLKDATARVTDLVFGLPVAMNGFLANAFTVVPSVSLTNHSGTVGSANVLNGSGFGAARSVTAVFGAANLSLTGPCVTAANGSFSCGFTVPPAPDGQQTVQATDAASNSASTTFAVSSAPTAADGNISGRITNDDGTPVSGVVVRLSGAQARKTITDSNGNYHFDNVETTGFYTVTPARVNYNFNPFNRAFSLIGNQLEATFTASSMGDSVNPLDTPEYFVRQQYLDFLGREPDEVGFNYWSDRINQCLSEPSAPAAGPTPADCIRSTRTAVSAAFFIEQEFQQSGTFIYNLYEAALGRRPAFTEYTTDRQQLVVDANLETRRTAFAQRFVERAEFAQKYQAETTAEAFVDALIQNVRQSTAVDLSEERERLIDAYKAGADPAQGRALALRTVADNAIFKQANYNAAFVLTEYFGYLRRDPEHDGYRFWLNVLANIGEGDEYRGMVCSFVTSAEYQKRFSSVVTHNNGECGQ
jgi:Carboxypeptidase regulatory-like domain